MTLLFWICYILCWLGGVYFNRPQPNTTYNFGWALPLICIGILGYAVLHLPR